eukprot:243411_1
MQSLQRTPKQLINHTPLLTSHHYFSTKKYAIPGKTFKTDCWPGLENTRTYLRGYVKEWHEDEGWGVIIDAAEKDNDYRVQCNYYVHWTDIVGKNIIKSLDLGIPVAFEAVEEDMNNDYYKDIPRSHMYDYNRKKFRTYTRNYDSNRVRAINVHRLDRVNWDEDYIEIDENNNNINQNINDENDKDLLDPNKQYENVSNDVLKTVEYRNNIRKRDIKNGHTTLNMIKMEYGNDINVHNKPMDEIESDEIEKQKYYEEKKYETRQYPYGCDEEDILEQDLAKYSQWFPELAKKYGNK